MGRLCRGGGGAGGDGDAFVAVVAVKGGVDVAEGGAVLEPVPSGDVSSGEDPAELVVGAGPEGGGVISGAFFLSVRAGWTSVA